MGLSYELTFEAAIAGAAARGATIVAPAPNELFIDIDTTEDWERLDERLDLLRRFVDVLDVVQRRSASGFPHYHVTVTLGRAVTSNMERCLLQACLGSDLKHELLSWAAIIGRKTDTPTVFFEAP